MDIPRDLDELTRLFEKLGASEPRTWAESQLRDGTPQLQRFLFLRQAWRRIINESGVAWLDQEIADAEAHPTAPYAAAGSALRRASDKGVSPQDLTDIARGVQARLLFDICYLLEDPAFTERELVEFGRGAI